MKLYLLFSLIILIVSAVLGLSIYGIPVSDKTQRAAAYYQSYDHPDSPWYTPFSINSSPDNTCVLIQVPSHQQESEYSCGPAAALDNLEYYGNKGNEMEIARQMGAVPVYGTDVGHMQKWFEDRGWIVHSSNTDGAGTLELLQKNLKAGIPTMVAWADWGGHWMVVTGYDTMGTDTPLDDVIIFADPYDFTDHNQDGYYRFPAARFLALWFVPHWYPDNDAIRPWLTAVPGPNTT